MFFRSLYLSIVILLCPFLSFGQEHKPVSNIVLITLDDLGQEVGFFGDTIARTPFIDSLSRAATNFTNAYVTQSSCSPSRASILTGLYPFQHGQIGLANDKSDFKLKDHIVSLPNTLRADGFQSFSIGKVHIAGSEDVLKFDFMDGRTEKTRDSVHVLRLLNRIYHRGQGKYFTMINLYDPHVNSSKSIPDQVNNVPQITYDAKDMAPLPYQLVTETEQLTRIASYYNAVSRADLLVEKVFAFFKERKLLDKTLFILLSNNGAPFNRGKTSNYESGLKTPLIFVTPAQSEPMQITEMVSTIDLMPTILDYAGVEIPSMLAGKSLKSLTDGKSTWTDHPIFTEFHYHDPSGYYPRRAVRFKNWKLIHNIDTTISMPHQFVDGDKSGEFVKNNSYIGTKAREVMNRYYNPPEFELYNLDKDPHELNNLSHDVKYVPTRRRLSNMLKPQIPGKIQKEFSDLQKPISIFQNFLIDSIWIETSHDHEEFEVINRNEIRWTGKEEGEQFELSIHVRNAYGEVFNSHLKLKAASYTALQHIPYGPLERQFLDIYQAKSATPSPVYFDAHSNGATTALPNSLIQKLTEEGISIVSWESIPTLKTITDVARGWHDAERMIQWAKNAANTYNFDTTKFFIGGSSRGSIVSWRIAHSYAENVKGIYMYNALPDVVWQRPDRWYPPEDVTTSSPPLFLVYGFEPGVNDAHDPDNGIIITRTYDSLGIGQLDSLVHSIVYSENPDKYQFLLDFIKATLHKPLVKQLISDVVLEEDQDIFEIADLSNVFKSSDGEPLNYTITDDFEGNLIVSLDNTILKIQPRKDFNGTGIVKITASNNSHSTAVSLRVTIYPINDIPVSTTELEPLEVVEDIYFEFSLPSDLFSDADEEILTVTSSSLPAWLSFDGTTFSGTPLNEDVGLLTITLTATDSSNTSASTDLSLSITNVNDAPIIVTPVEDIVVNEDAASYSIDLSDRYIDVDSGDAVHLSVSSMNPNLIEASITKNILTLDFTADQYGLVSILITASDNQGATVVDTLIATVNPVNDVPVATTELEPLEVVEDTYFELSLPSDLFSDADEEILTVTASYSPDWLSFDGTTFSGTPLNEDVGLLTITVTATDSSNTSASTDLSLSITNVNDAPIIVTPVEDLDVDEDAAASSIDLSDRYMDVDLGDAVHLSVSNMYPALIKATISEKILTLDYTPDQHGSGIILINATDKQGATVVDTLVASVNPINDAPIITAELEPLEAAEDTYFELTLSPNLFSDVEEDILTLTSNSLPNWLSFDGATFSGTPLNEDVGALAITITATDSSGASASTNLTLSVTNVNDAPVIVTPVEDLIVDEDAVSSSIDLSDKFMDVDTGDAVHLSVSSMKPALIKASITKNILTLDYAPDQHGSGSILITASDNQEATKIDTLYITVNSINDEPSFSLSKTELEIDENSTEQLIYIVPEVAPENERDQRVTYTIQSDDPEIVTTTLTNQTIAVKSIVGATGTQNFTITADDGQDANHQYTLPFSVSVKNASVDVVLSLNEEQPSLRIYPNPATKQLFFISDQELEILIYSLDGKVRIHDRVTGSIDISALQAGVYIVQIVDIESVQSHRIIKIN